MPRFPKAAVAGLLLLPLVAGAFVVQERSAQTGARLFDQVLGLVAERYVDSVDVGALYEKAARGLIAQLKDPYAELYTPKQVEAFNQNTGGFYAGTGMSIEDQHGNIIVVKVFPHTPASDAGMMTGDQIVFVDTFNVKAHAWKTDSVSAHLKGAPGTKVTASFLRAGNSGSVPGYVHAPRRAHSGGRIRDHARQQDRVHPRAAVQRDGGV